MILIQLYPFVYCDVINNKYIFLCNTFSKETKVLHFKKKISILKLNAFILEECGVNKDLAEEIKGSFWGIVDTSISVPPDLLIDYPTELFDFYHLFFTEQWDNQFVAKTFVSRLIVNMSNHMDMFSYKINKYQDSPLITKERIHLLRDKYSKLEKLSAVVFNLPIYDYLSFKNIIPNMQKGQLHIVVPSLDGVFRNDINNIIQSHQQVTVRILVRNISDYKRLEKWNFINNEHIGVGVSPNSTRQDLDRLLCYEIKNLLKPSLSIYSMIRNEWYNALYWGSLYINANGKVMMNEKDCIGNIEAWDDIQFSKLLSDKSIWRDVRNKHRICKNCYYRNLCPPVSEIERHTQGVFCTLRKKSK